MVAASMTWPVWIMSSSRGGDPALLHVGFGWLTVGRSGAQVGGQPHAEPLAAEPGCLMQEAQQPDTPGSQPRLLGQLDPGQVLRRACRATASRPAALRELPGPAPDRVANIQSHQAACGSRPVVAATRL